MCSGPRSSPPCGASISPARSAIRNAGANSAVLPRRSSLERPKPTTPWPAYCAASRARVRASSGCRVRLAAMITAIPRPVRSLASRTASSTRSVNAVMPVEAGGVPAGVDLDLQPPPAVAYVVLGGLEHQPAYVVLRAQHRPRHVVEALEAEPALLVVPPKLGRPVLDQRVGQVDAVAVGQLEQRGVPHRAGEVQVQVRLRQRLEVAHSALEPGSGVELGNHARILGGAPGPFWWPASDARRLPHWWIPHASPCPERDVGRSEPGPPEGTSSTGRASVSKTEGWGFKSLVPCSSSQLRNDER